MSDLISRQAAIEAVLDRCPSDYDSEYECGYYDALKETVPMLIHVPSVQPVGKDINVPCTDTISRRAAIDAILAIKDYGNSDRANALGLAECAVTTLPSVQPEQIARDIATIIENEKDMRVILKNERTETHSCDYQRTETHDWIPVTERLPKESDGKVLITVSGKVETGQYSEFSTTWFIGDMNGVGGDDPIAWMPLPEPWRGQDETN